MPRKRTFNGRLCPREPTPEEIPLPFDIEDDLEDNCLDHLYREEEGFRYQDERKKKEERSNQSNNMVHCEKCKSWLHTCCDDLIEDKLDKTKHWFCPLCIHKETPTSHITKLNQVLIICMTNIYLTYVDLVFF